MSVTLRRDVLIVVHGFNKGASHLSEAVCYAEQQLGRVQSEMKRQGTQLQEANSQLDKAKQSLQESTQSLKASQKAAEYVALSDSRQSSLARLHKQP